MAKLSFGPTREILEAALLGLEAQKQKLDEQIMQVRSLLGRRAGRPSKSAQVSIAASVSGPGVTRRKRVLSPEARKRIAAAQKKRWAAFRKKQA